MSRVLLRTVGRCQIFIEHEGCCDCGTPRSSSWHLVNKICVQSSTLRQTIEVSRCDDCHRRKTVGTAPAAPSLFEAKEGPDAT